MRRELGFILKFLINSIAILLTSLVLPGVSIDSFKTALLVALLLGAVNTVLRPVIFVLTLPINILTLGLFSFVIMGTMVLLVAKVVPGFEISHFFWTIPFALMVSFLNGLFSKFMIKKVLT